MAATTAAQPRFRQPAGSARRLASQAAAIRARLTMAATTCIGTLSSRTGSPARAATCSGSRGLTAGGGSEGVLLRVGGGLVSARRGWRGRLAAPTAARFPHTRPDQQGDRRRGLTAACSTPMEMGMPSRLDSTASSRLFSGS